MNEGRTEHTTTAIMVVLTTLEERRRRSRNIVFAAFILLIIIWTYKMVHPKSTLISYYYQNSLPSTQPATSPSTPKSANPNSNPNADKWKTVAPAVETADTFNGTVTTKAAVIVETRFRTNLIPLILHFSSVLGPSWPILIYTSPEALGFFASSAALARFTSTGVIQIRLLPQTVLFTDSDSVNAFMTGPWLWEHLAPAEHILIFQSDSMLCANAARSVDDFFVYDIVGAPMKKETKGYNKGLSLRKRSTVLKVLDNWEWKTTKKVGDRFEDQWFYNRFVFPSLAISLAPLHIS